MFTQALGSFISTPHSLFKDLDSEKHHPLTDKDNKQDSQKRLADDLFEPISFIDDDVSKVTDSRMALQQLSTSLQQSTEINITTNEGDSVSIQLSLSTASDRTTFQMKQGGTQASVFDENHSSSYEYILRVDGDINKDEQKALEKIINKMNKVSHSFFNGDIQTAFRHAQNVGFDANQIAGFSMQLNSKETVNALAAYQQTALPEQNVNTNRLKQAGEFLAESKAFMADAEKMLDSLAQPKQSFVELLEGLGQLHSDAGEQQALESSMPLYLTLIENLADDLFDNLDVKA